MALADKFYGPMTLTFNDISSGTKAYSTLKRDTVTINIERLEDRMEFEDGSAADTEAGSRITVEGNISDIVPADMDTIEGYSGDLTILFTKPSKTLTIPGTAAQPNNVFVSMDDGKMHFKVTNNWPLATTHATMFQIA